MKDLLARLLVHSVLSAVTVLAGEYTFELPDNEKQCFHEVIDKGTKSTLEFQVITGGNYDVDMELVDPSGQLLYKESKKQYDSFTWTAALKGEHRFCFSNEFSTFTHKVVYFDLQVGDEDVPLGPDFGDHVTAMTQMESSAVTIHEALKVVADYQTHHKLRETTGRAFAEDVNERVQYWSIGVTVVIFLIGVGEVLVLRSFFTDKKNKPTHT